MPNIWTHLIFGQHVLRETREAEKIADPDMERLFNFGCQGPDFLFYHNYLPWKKDKTMNRLGSAMHSRHCGPVIMDMLEGAIGLPDSHPEREQTLVYTMGFVLHHILDRNMHPYVFSRSGFRKWDHQRFEVMMDTLVARELLGLQTWKTPVWHELRFGSRLPERVVDCFEEIAACHYPDLATSIETEDWHQAARDMVQAHRLFYDPTGIRRLLTFGQFEALVYKRYVPPLDILNEHRESWIDPTNAAIRHDDSVWMLWEQSMIEAKEVIRSIIDWLREARTGSDSLESGDSEAMRARTAALIANRSYETGLDCDSGPPIRFAQSIWPDGGVNLHEEASRAG
ncbi:hypothetical protein [Paenibacillus sp. 1P07SE]|uniref:hypothetical protein n=1 Tax=Paenibacillus sp. 1P07SE TaxID=3132209 RepID=UPI0039A61F1E